MEAKTKRVLPVNLVKGEFIKKRSQSWESSWLT